MDLLLDTHTLLWWVDDAPQLSAMARKAIMEADGFVYVSLASVWELAIKVSLRKLRLALPVKQYVPYHLAANGFIQLPIDFSHICQVETLPWHHRDPFDRLLIAQAQAGSPARLCRRTVRPLRYPAYLVTACVAR